MGEATIVGVDVAKNVFKSHGAASIAEIGHSPQRWGGCRSPPNGVAMCQARGVETS